MTTWAAPRRQTRKAERTDERSGPADGAGATVATPSAGPIPGLIAGATGQPLANPVRRFVLRRNRLEDLKKGGEAVTKLAETAPRSGANLWVARDKVTGATVHLIGTHHHLALYQVQAWERVVNHLTTTPFSQIFTETTPAATVSIPTGDALLKDLQLAAKARAALDPIDKELVPQANILQGIKARINDLRREQQERADDPDAGPRLEEIALELKGLDVQDDDLSPAVNKLQRQQRIVGNRFQTLPEYAAKVQGLGLDDAYLALARSLHSTAGVGLLDESGGRTIAALLNQAQGVQTRKGESVASVLEQEIKDVATGDQRALFEDSAKEKLEGLDNASTEERNRQWMHALIAQDTSERQTDEVKMRLEKQTPDTTSRQRVKQGDVQLWIVGASHLPGLILKFRVQGWAVDHLDPA